MIGIQWNALYTVQNKLNLPLLTIKCGNLIYNFFIFAYAQDMHVIYLNLKYTVCFAYCVTSKTIQPGGGGDQWKSHFWCRRLWSVGAIMYSTFNITPIIDM